MMFPPGKFSVVVVRGWVRKQPHELQTSARVLKWLAGFIISELMDTGGANSDQGSIWKQSRFVTVVSSHTKRFVNQNRIQEKTREEMKDKCKSE
jgi:hypothetical protein